jgi:hypothetical protein
MDNKESIIIKCQRCKKEWKYKGKKLKYYKIISQYTCCPYCRTTVKIKEIIEEK